MEIERKKRSGMEEKENLLEGSADDTSEGAVYFFQFS